MDQSEYAVEYRVVNYLDSLEDGDFRTCFELTPLRGGWWHIPESDFFGPRLVTGALLSQERRLIEITVLLDGGHGPEWVALAGNHWAYGLEAVPDEYRGLPDLRLAIPAGRPPEDVDFEHLIMPEGCL